MSGRSASAGRLEASDAVVWHDVECAGYEADRDLWRALADEVSGPLVELGAGTGRVALDLAARGHAVTALDSDPDLCAELARRARAAGVRVRIATGDARSFELGRRFSLALAPMQVVQLLGGEAGRSAMLASVRRHLVRGGLLALALADPLEGLSPDDVLPPLPDVREVGGWVYSSRPVDMRDAGEAIEIDRLREVVSPSGDLHESRATLRLDHVHPEALVAQAEARGFRRLPARSVPPTRSYVGSLVVMLEAA